VVNGVHASEGGQQPSLVHLLRTYSTLLKHQLVTHDYIPGVLCGSNRLGKRLLEPLKLKGSSVASMPKIGHNSLPTAKRFHVGWQGQGTCTLVVVHPMDTNEKSH
jgi:hypothetical protein